MAKYSYKLKLKIVLEYIDGKGGFKYLANKYNIKSKTQVIQWVNNYKALGKEGLLRKRQNLNYPLEFKLDMINCYLRTEISYNDLALNNGISNSNLIAQWVSQFRKYGVTGISKNQGRPLIMEDNKTKKKINNENNSTIEKLNLELVNCKAELLNYKIENAYLKELRRLRLEETLKMKK